MSSDLSATAQPRQAFQLKMVLDSAVEFSAVSANGVIEQP